jgi:chromosome segregation ATPase
MISELDTLEAKIRLVAERCDTLRSDNGGLRQQLITAQQEIKQLNARLESARARLQTLLDKIPEDV